jgi:hypothetical protein
MQYVNAKAWLTARYHITQDSTVHEVKYACVPLFYFMHITIIMMDSIGLMECKSKSLNYVRSVLGRVLKTGNQGRYIDYVHGYDSPEVGSDI